MSARDKPDEVPPAIRGARPVTQHAPYRFPARLLILVPTLVLLTAAMSARTAAAQTVSENLYFGYTPSTPSITFRAAEGPIVLSYNWIEQRGALSALVPLLRLRLLRPDGTEAASVANLVASPIGLTYNATAADVAAGYTWTIGLQTVATTMSGKVAITHAATPTQSGWDIALDTIFPKVGYFHAYEDRPAQVDFGVRVRNAGTKTLRNFYVSCKGSGLEFGQIGGDSIRPGQMGNIWVYAEGTLDHLNSGQVPVDCIARLSSGTDVIDADTSNNRLLGSVVARTTPTNTNLQLADLELFRLTLRKCGGWTPPTADQEACMSVRYSNLGAVVAVPYDIQCTVGPQSFTTRKTNLLSSLDSVVLGRLPAGLVFIPCALDARNEVGEVDENNNKGSIGGVIYPAGTRFRYDIALEAIDSVFWIDNSGYPYEADFSNRFKVQVANLSDYEITQGGVACKLGGLEMYQALSDMPDHRSENTTLMKLSGYARAVEGLQPIQCYAEIRQPDGYRKDGNSSNDTITANVRVVGIANVPYAELLSVRPAKVNGSHVDLDVHYRVNPSLVNAQYTQLKVCLRDSAGNDMGQQFKLDSLVTLKRTGREGLHAEIGLTWTDATVEAPTFAIVHAEVRSGTEQSAKPPCAISPIQSATRTFNPRGPIYAARNFRASLGWAMPVTLARKEPNRNEIDMSGYTPAKRTPQRVATSDSTKRTRVPPPKARPPVPADEPVSDGPAGKTGSYRIVFPNGTVEGTTAVFCSFAIANDGFMLNFGGPEGGLFGGITGHSVTKDVKSYPITDNGEVGINVGLTRLDHMQSYPATAGRFTITEWTSTYMAGSFRYTGTSADAEGVEHPHVVTGTFKAVHMDGCE